MALGSPFAAQKHLLQHALRPSEVSNHGSSLWIMRGWRGEMNDATSQLLASPAQLAHYHLLTAHLWTAFEERQKLCHMLARVYEFYLKSPMMCTSSQPGSLLRVGPLGSSAMQRLRQDAYDPQAQQSLCDALVIPEESKAAETALMRSTTDCGVPEPYVPFRHRRSDCCTREVWAVVPRRTTCQAGWRFPSHPARRCGVHAIIECEVCMT